ncbi:MAG: hypothetical protein KC680_04525, partial [Candidatus Peregrinibacteria bacterium]|nr:hypothetical protein [Candidatus Peregrinibacteria bacterium]
RGFGVEVPHGTSIEQAQQTLKVQLEAQGHSTKISGDTMVVTMWNGEKMEVEFLHVAENSNASEETVTSETDVEQVHSDISETLSESQLESNEAQSQELSPEVVTARENLRAQLEKSGEILPPEHPASQFLMRVTNRLGKPDDIAVICLDSEAWMAGYEPSSRTVVVSREFLRTVVKSIPDASEDHVAAVLAHELEHRHADVKEWEKAKKPFTNPTAYFSANFNHSEELRADAEGMEQLARTGYDPMAMIEMLDKVLGVGSGRGDRAHPETIDRIRHLENRLADDEHPIANIGKEHTPFDPELLNWIEQKSEVYDKTDELLSMNDEQLADALGSAETVEEFWTVLKVIKHREAVGEAKAIAGEDRLRGLYTNMIALEALESLCKCKVLNFEGDTDSELRKTEWARALNDAANKTQSPYKIRLESSVGLNDVLASSGHVERALRSASDREKTDTHELSSADRERLSEDLAKAEAYVQEKLQQLLSAAEEQQLPPREQHFLEHIKQTLESGQISPEILRAVYAGYDQEYVQQKRAKEDTERSERGMRGHDTAREPLTRDLRNPDVRERLEKDLELTVALHFAGKPEVSEEMVANLQNLLEKQHNLDSQSASALSRILLEGGSTQEWEQFTKAQSNDVLVRIIDALDHLPQSGFMRISPVRRSHDAYKASEENLPLVHSATHRGGSVRYRDYSFTDYSGVEAMQYIAGWELLSRGHPDGHLESQKQFLPPDQVTLSPAEWKAVTNAGVRGTESLMTTKAIQTFVEAGGDISKIPDEFREALQTSSSLPENLKPNELLTLLEHNPWDS